MRLAAVALGALVMAGLTPLQAAAAHHADRQQIQMRALATPQGGEDFLFRLAFHDRAQKLSDGMFSALVKVLGGQAPSLNFVSDGSISGTQGEVEHLSATPSANRINLDAYATQGLIDDAARTHNGAVNGVPHEMAHLRQSAPIYASTPEAEGGAQAFADIVSPLAAAAAKTRYDGGNFDGLYADYVKQANARGRDWIFGGQFGKPPVAWP